MITENKIKIKSNQTEWKQSLKNVKCYSKRMLKPFYSKLLGHESLAFCKNRLFTCFEVSLEIYI